MSTELEAVIRERIEKDGPMPFAAFMSHALYHPKLGYYARGVPRTGWSGHYLTSPEIDPVFGELWTRAFEEVWERCDRPDGFRIIEVGPGEASFAAAVLDHAHGPFADALSYVLVERVPAVEERQRARLGADARVSWAKAVDEVPPASGCVWANEVLDNLPVHMIEVRDGRVVEILVEEEQGRLVLTRRPPAGAELTDFAARNGIELLDGHLHELPIATESFVARAARVLERGALVFVDYGLDARGFAERPEGTLVCYSATGTDTEPLERIGEKDLTVHANWTVVGNVLRASGCKVVGPLLQRRVLSALGLGEVDEQLRRDHDLALSAGSGSAALGALSRRQALGALSDPGGLGGLQVVTGLKGVEPPSWLDPRA